MSVKALRITCHASLLPFQERGSVEGAASEVAGINTDEAVHGTSVSAEPDDARVHLVVNDSIDVGVNSVHWLRSWSLVPV